jgi:hypothetical protein
LQHPFSPDFARYSNAKHRIRRHRCPKSVFATLNATSPAAVGSLTAITEPDASVKKQQA